MPKTFDGSNLNAPVQDIVWDTAVPDEDGNQYPTWESALAAAQAIRDAAPVRLIIKLDLFDYREIPAPASGRWDLWGITVVPDTPFGFIGLADGCLFDGWQRVGDEAVANGLAVFLNQNTVNSPFEEAGEFLEFDFAASGCVFAQDSAASVPYFAGNTEWGISHSGGGACGMGELPGDYNPAFQPILDASSGAELSFFVGGRLGKGAIGGTGGYVTAILREGARDHSLPDDTDYSAYFSTEHPNFNGTWLVDNKGLGRWTTDVYGDTTITADFFDARYNHSHKVDSTAGDVVASFPAADRRNGSEIKCHKKLSINNMILRPRVMLTGTADSFTEAAGIVTMVKVGLGANQDHVGKFLSQSGSTSPGNDSPPEGFVITEVVDADTIKFANASGVTEAGAGTFVINECRLNDKVTDIVVGSGSAIASADAEGNWMVGLMG